MPEPTPQPGDTIRIQARDKGRVEDFFGTILESQSNGLVIRFRADRLPKALATAGENPHADFKFFDVQPEPDPSRSADFFINRVLEFPKTESYIREIRPPPQ